MPLCRGDYAALHTFALPQIKHFGNGLQAGFWASVTMSTLLLPAHLHKGNDGFPTGLSVRYADIPHSTRDAGMTHERANLSEIHIVADQLRAGCVLQDVGMSLVLR